MTTAVPSTETPSTSVISDGTSTTGWTANATLTSVSGALRLGGTNPSGSGITLSMTRSGLALNFGVRPNIYFDYRCTAGVLRSTPVATADSAPMPLVSAGQSPLGPGWNRLVVRGAGTASTFGLRFEFQGAAPGSARTVEVDNITATSVLPAPTPFQRSLIVPVGGSVPTEGSIHISHPTDALGDVIAYTCEPQILEYAPNLGRYAWSGISRTPDTSLVSGARNSLDAGFVADIPTTKLPNGTYAIWARLRSDTLGAQGVNWSTELRIDTDNTVPGGSASASTELTFASTGKWELYPVGLVQLPGAWTGPTSDAAVRLILIAASAAASNIDVDEVWLFNMSIGELTVVSGDPLPGSTPPVVRNLWIDTPTIERPMPSISRGAAADKSDAYGAGSFVKCWGRHRLTPTQQAAFVVTTGAQNVSVYCEHYPRWSNYAAG